MDEEIEYLEEYEDLVFPSIVNNSNVPAKLIKNSTTMNRSKSPDSDSSSIDQDIFETLFDNVSDDEIVKKDEPPINNRRSKRDSLDSIDALVKDLGAHVARSAVKTPSILPPLKSKMSSPQKSLNPSPSKRTPPLNKSAEKQMLMNVRQSSSKSSSTTIIREKGRPVATIVRPEKIITKDPAEDPLKLDEDLGQLCLSEASSDESSMGSNVIKTMRKSRKNKAKQDPNISPAVVAATAAVSAATSTTMPPKSGPVKEKVKIISNTQLKPIDKEVLKSISSKISIKPKMNFAKALSDDDSLSSSDDCDMFDTLLGNDPDLNSSSSFASLMAEAKPVHHGEEIQPDFELTANEPSSLPPSDLMQTPSTSLEATEMINANVQDLRPSSEPVPPTPPPPPAPASAPAPAPPPVSLPNEEKLEKDLVVDKVVVSSSAKGKPAAAAVVAAATAKVVEKKQLVSPVLNGKNPLPLEIPGVHKESLPLPVSSKSLESSSPEVTKPKLSNKKGKSNARSTESLNKTEEEAKEKVAEEATVPLVVNKAKRISSKTEHATSSPELQSKPKAKESSAASLTGCETAKDLPNPKNINEIPHSQAKSEVAAKSEDSVAKEKSLTLKKAEDAALVSLKKLSNQITVKQVRNNSKTQTLANRPASPTSPTSTPNESLTLNKSLTNTPTTRSTAASLVNVASPKTVEEDDDKPLSTIKSKASTSRREKASTPTLSNNRSKSLIITKQIVKNTRSLPKKDQQKMLEVNDFKPDKVEKPSKETHTEGELKASSSKEKEKEKEEVVQPPLQMKIPKDVTIKTTHKNTRKSSTIKAGKDLGEKTVTSSSSSSSLKHDDLPGKSLATGAESYKTRSTLIDSKAHSATTITAATTAEPTPPLSGEVKPAAKRPGRRPKTKAVALDKVQTIAANSEDIDNLLNSLMSESHMNISDSPTPTSHASPQQNQTETKTKENSFTCRPDEGEAHGEEGAAADSADDTLMDISKSVEDILETLTKDNEEHLAKSSDFSKDKEFISRSMASDQQQDKSQEGADDDDDECFSAELSEDLMSIAREVNAIKPCSTNFHFNHNLYPLPKKSIIAFRLDATTKSSEEPRSKAATKSAKTKNESKEKRKDAKELIIETPGQTPPLLDSTAKKTDDLKPVEKPDKEKLAEEATADSSFSTLTNRRRSKKLKRQKKNSHMLQTIGNKESEAAEQQQEHDSEQQAHAPEKKSKLNPSSTDVAPTLEETISAAPPEIASALPNLRKEIFGTNTDTDTDHDRSNNSTPVRRRKSRLTELDRLVLMTQEMNDPGMHSLIRQKITEALSDQNRYELCPAQVDNTGSPKVVPPLIIKRNELTLTTTNKTHKSPTREAAKRAKYSSQFQVSQASPTKLKEDSTSPALSKEDVATPALLDDHEVKEKNEKKTCQEVEEKQETQQQQEKEKEEEKGKEKEENLQHQQEEQQPQIQEEKAEEQRPESSLNADYKLKNLKVLVNRRTFNQFITHSNGIQQQPLALLPQEESVINHIPFVLKTSPQNSKTADDSPQKSLDSSSASSQDTNTPPDSTRPRVGMTESFVETGNSSLMDNEASLLTALRSEPVLDKPQLKKKQIRKRKRARSTSVELPISTSSSMPHQLQQTVQQQQHLNPIVPHPFHHLNVKNPAALQNQDLNSSMALLLPPKEELPDPDDEQEENQETQANHQISTPLQKPATSTPLRPLAAAKSSTSNSLCGKGSYNFLYPAKCHPSCGNVLLDFCCPDLEGPLTAVNPARLHSQLNTEILELPSLIVLTTKLITKEELQANKSFVPASVRQKLQRSNQLNQKTNSSNSSNTQGPSSRPVPLALTPAASLIKNQMPNRSSSSASSTTSSLSSKNKKSLEPQPAEVQTQTQAQAQAQAVSSEGQELASLNHLDLQLLRLSHMLLTVSFAERHAAMEAIVMQKKYSHHELETARAILQDYEERIINKNPIPITVPAAPTTTTLNNSNSTPNAQQQAGTTTALHNQTSTPTKPTAIAHVQTPKTPTPIATNNKTKPPSKTAAKPPPPPPLTKAESNPATSTPTPTSTVDNVPIYGADNTIIGYQLKVVTQNPKGAANSKAVKRPNPAAAVSRASPASKALATGNLLSTSLPPAEKQRRVHAHAGTSPSSSIQQSASHGKPARLGATSTLQRSMSGSLSEAEAGQNATTSQRKPVRFINVNFEDHDQDPVVDVNTTKGRKAVNSSTSLQQQPNSSLPGHPFQSHGADQANMLSTSTGLIRDAMTSQPFPTQRKPAGRPVKGPKRLSDTPKNSPITVNPRPRGRPPMKNSKRSMATNSAPTAAPSGGRQFYVVSKDLIGQSYTNDDEECILPDKPAAAPSADHIKSEESDDDFIGGL